MKSLNQLSSSVSKKKNIYFLGEKLETVECGIVFLCKNSNVSLYFIIFFIAKTALSKNMKCETSAK